MAQLERKRTGLAEGIADAKRELVDAASVGEYANDLKGLLRKGSIVEQKTFLRSFIKRIELRPPQVVIDCTIPFPTQKVEPLTREVLPFALEPLISFSLCAAAGPLGWAAADPQQRKGLNPVGLSPIGSTGRARTCNQPVNSRLLYH